MHTERENQQQSGGPEVQESEVQEPEAQERASQHPVYHISIVAEMLSTHPQTLRMYERMGLISPQRTRNNIRLYSDDDIERVRRIQHLTQDLGVNLAGVDVDFKLLAEMEKLRAQIKSSQIKRRAQAEPQHSSAQPDSQDSAESEDG